MVITVAMVHPVTRLAQAINFCCCDRNNLSSWLAVGGTLLLACLPVVVQSADWDGTARLGLSEIYSDNIRLSVADEEHESITTITPGFSLTGQGARLKLGLDYSMQNAFYANNSAQNHTSHQLRANEQAELIKDLFYFDSNASISQQLIDPGDSFSQDNLSLSGERSDVVTLQVEPYLKRSLGSYLVAEMRYSHGWVDYDSGGVSAAESSVASAYLENGHGATHLSWRLGYRQQKDIRDTGPDSERRASDGMVRYSVTNAFSLVGYAGREENDIQTSRSSADGTYWSAGFNWTPGPKLSLEATTGENFDQARLSWNPLSRTSVNITYSDREVGLNTGVSWSGQLSHRTRRSTWAFDYSEEVTNTQLLALKSQTSILFSDGQGGFLVDSNGDHIIGFVNEFELTDEEFLRARAQGTVSYRTGKSNVTLVAYNELRTYELSGSELASEGGNISWRWQFAPRTSSMISIHGQRFEVLTSPDKRQSLTTRLNINRTLSSRMNARLELSHLEADATNGNQEYVENRISAHLNMSF